MLECVHYWVLEEGAKTKGQCKRCDAERLFDPPSIEVYGRFPVGVMEEPDAPDG